MESVTSTDGTRIAFARRGAGRPLVLVHGGTADHRVWDPVLAPLGRHRTVYAVDRRGRGASGDADAGSYRIEDEFADLVAVIEAIGEPTDVLGHSYGAICALEAAVRTDRLRRLALYEPPIPTPPGTPIIPPAELARVRALIDVGDRAAALDLFHREVVRMPEEQILGLRQLPTWPSRLARAHTMVRELEAANAYTFIPARFAILRTPTLLLLGGDSPAYFGAAIEALHVVLPNSQVVVMSGQQHVAMRTAPDRFVQEVLRFLDA